ncbi:DUF5690 family protein [Myxococcota bacterium]|nr:DUF5690 family protein [Myxococcota bacterium]
MARRWLERASPAAFTIWATFAAFSTYFCMYGFRRAFAVGTHPGEIALPGLPPLDLKSFFIIAQVIGYAASKFLGIKIVSELTPAKRGVTIIGLIAASELALVAFAVMPQPWSAIALTANGLPLGMIWGLVFGFLEGRKTSDLLGVGLSVSFIVSSGVVKTVGRWVIGLGVSETWMPAVVGALFFGPLLLFVWMLVQIPPPTAEDEAERTKRAPMSARERHAFFWSHAAGLVALIAAYSILTAFRDFRDNFAREVWDALGFASEPAILTTAELPVAFGALVAVGTIYFVKNNRTALLGVHVIMLAGAGLIGSSTLLFDLGVIGPVAWMVSVGLGLYVGYVPFNSVLFDRLIAALGSVATAGFLIYVADAFGYLGSVGLLFYKSFATPNLSWLEFFRGFSYVTAAVTSILFVASALYFYSASSSKERAAEPMR